MQQARTISLTLMVTGLLRRAQVGITEDIYHEVFRSLLEGQNSYALHLQVALSYFLCELAYKMLEGGFSDEEICCFLELMDLP
jgi:hypothetical protein